MGIGILRPATLNQSIVEVVKVVDIGLNTPANLSQVIEEVMDVGQVLPATFSLVILEDMLIEVYLGHNIPDTLYLTTS